MIHSPTPHEDPQLVAFLQHHTPPPPPPPPDLEDRILAQILSEAEHPGSEQSIGISTLLQRKADPSHPVASGSSRRSQTPLRLVQRRTVWIPSLVAAGLVMVWSGSALLSPPSEELSPAEIAELETFLQSQWIGLTQASDDADLFSL